MAGGDRFSDKQLLVPRILWVSFIFSHLAFAGVGWMAMTPSPDPVELGDPMVAYIIVGLGALIPLLAPLIVPLLAKSTRPPTAEGPAAAFTPMLIDLAMREVGGIMALVVLFMTGDWMLWSIPATVGLTMTILAFPSSKRLEAWV